MKRLALSQSGKEASKMVANDVILRLVEMLLSEKDKNTELQLIHLQQKLTQEKTDKDWL